MNEINPFPSWLEEVAGSPLVVDQSKKGLSVEAHGNCWTFSVHQWQANALTGNDILAFLFSIMQAREEQIKARPGAINPMVFYCWFDEQASHLCFSLVSTSHDCLPFGAKLDVTNDFSRIVKQFSGNHHHDGISMNEFMSEEEFAKLNLPARPPFVLLVATKVLPVTSTGD